LLWIGRGFQGGQMLRTHRRQGEPTDCLDDSIELEGAKGVGLHRGEPLILPHGRGHGEYGRGTSNVFAKSPNSVIPSPYRWLMSDAMAAAPKPLSIFTTDTPVAQLFSIPSRAARPPKLAPYPTLVGTAITGTPTSPAMTLGKAPSIPPTTIITRAAARRSRSPSSRCRPATPTSYNRQTSFPINSAVR